MATYTSNYGWTKPSGSDNVDISVLNDNLDDQDSTIHDAFLNMAPPFSESSTYAVDDIVLYGTGLYKCHTAVVTPGSWTGSTNWQVYKLSEGGSGGGGTSNYNQLTNKPQINSVELSGNKTAAQLGLMASDGVVANPTGQTTGTLTALEVGGTKYAIPSGGGGTSDYTDLTNKPSINGVTLSGNKTTSDLGISYNDLTNKPSLATVATSGSYNDLSNKPTIPAAQVNSDWNASSGVAEILNKPSSYTPSSHKHGNIQNGGTLQTTDVDIANGDKLVVTDSSNSAKIARTSVAFDGTTTTQALSKKGTFETFSKFSGSYTDLTNKPQINGNTLTGNKITSDLGINATNVMMSDGVTSVEDAVDEIDGRVDSLNSNLTIKGVNVTLSDKCAQGSLIASGMYGNIVVFSMYIITASACSRNDVLATFDLPSDFSTNYFNAFTNGKLNLATHTKNLVADGSIAQGVTIIGQIIGIIS